MRQGCELTTPAHLQPLGVQAAQGELWHLLPESGQRQVRTAVPGPRVRGADRRGAVSAELQTVGSALPHSLQAHLLQPAQMLLRAHPVHRLRPSEPPVALASVEGTWGAKRGNGCPSIIQLQRLLHLLPITTRCRLPVASYRCGNGGPGTLTPPGRSHDEV